MLCGSLLFGTVFANAVSISFEDLVQSDKISDLDIGTDNVSITYEELQSEEVITEESLDKILFPLWQLK